MKHTTHDPVRTIKSIIDEIDNPILRRKKWYKIILKILILILKGLCEPDVLETMAHKLGANKYDFKKHLHFHK